jgi:hypothetical protein
MCRPPEILAKAPLRTARRSVPATFVGCDLGGTVGIHSGSAGLEAFLLPSGSAYPWKILAGLPRIGLAIVAPLLGAAQLGYVMFTKQAAMAFLAASQNARSLESTSCATNRTIRALNPCSPTPSDS